MTRRTRAREVALQLLFQRDQNPTLPPRPALKEFVHGRLGQAPLEIYCFSLFDGVVAQQEELDRRITQAAENWRLSRMAATDRNILRIGAYELLHTPELSPAVIIDEAIELARRYGTADSSSFVNGVLDRVRREAGSTVPPSSSNTPAPPADGA